ncbi:MAG: acetate--CoA ligase family protein, partial [Candidatus Binatia bacterium]
CRRERGDVLALDRFAVASIRAVVDRVLAAGAEPRWLSSEDVATLLRAAGIEVAASERVAAREAAAAAERIGYPLVAKLLSPDILHKSDVGGVIVGLRSAQEVSAAASRLTELAQSRGARFDGVLLQREVRGGSEALVGVTTDPTFGPLLVCGLGGVLVELLRDVSFRLTPVSRLDAEEMIASLRSAKLLDGYRGAPAGDRAALAGIIQRISALVEVAPEIRELDLNPVKVLEPGRGAVVVDARVRLGL